MIAKGIGPHVTLAGTATCIGIIGCEPFGRKTYEKTDHERDFRGASAVSALAADPVEGVWQTEVDDGSYALVDDGTLWREAICGVISRTFNADGEYKSENLGKKIVIDMAAKGGGKYEGQVWRPSNNKIYIGKMDVSGEQDEVAWLRCRGLAVFVAELDQGAIS